MGNVGDGPVKGRPSQVDVEALYRKNAANQKAIDDLTATIANMDTLPDPSAPGQIEPCTPDFILDRVVVIQGEKPVMCVTFAPGSDIDKLTVVLRMVKVNGQLDTEKISYKFKDITDDQKAAGHFEGVFGIPLKFDRQFNVIRFIAEDSNKLETKTPPAGSALTEAQQLTSPLVSFRTGSAQESPTRPGNLLRNADFSRSFRAYKSTGTPTVEGQQCFGWYFNCNKTIPVGPPAGLPLLTTAHASYIAGSPRWDKVNGALSFWGSNPATNIYHPSHRIKHRALRAGRTYYFNARLQIPFTPGGNISATLIARLYSASGGLGSPVLAQMASGFVQIGNSSLFFRDAADETQERNNPIPEPISGIETSVQIPLIVNASYALSSTPSPDVIAGADGNGQWIQLELAGLNVSGGAYFEIKDCRLGKNPGAYSPHPEDEQINSDYDLTGSAPFSGVDGATFNDGIVGIGTILRRISVS